MREKNILEIVVMLHEPIYRTIWMISEITCLLSSVVAVVEGRCRNWCNSQS